MHNVKRSKRAISDDDIVIILESTLSNTKMGEVYGISRQTVQQIRNGKTYADVRPDIPRVGGRSCKKCQHWHNERCMFDFPDPIEEGIYAARYCNLYLSC